MTPCDDDNDNDDFLIVENGGILDNALSGGVAVRLGGRGTTTDETDTGTELATTTGAATATIVDSLSLAGEFEPSDTATGVGITVEALGDVATCAT